MIDIGKKSTLYFLQNVWECTVFPHLHLTFAKSAIMTPKTFFIKNINKGIKNAELNAPKKIKCKKCKRFEKRNTQNSHGFLAVALFRAFV